METEKKSSNMPESPPIEDVIIIGGSLAGLMHACTILHESPNSKVTILERSPGLLHNQGAGVVCGHETQALFTEYVHPQREITVTSHQRLYLDRKGGVIDGSVADHAQQMTSWDLLYRLLRWRVDGKHADEYFGHHKGEESHLPSNDGAKATYQPGCTVTSVKGRGQKQGVVVSFMDQNHKECEITGSFLIAADGANSIVRQQLRPEVERQYAGYVAVRGTVPENALSEAAASVFVERFCFFHADGNQILAYTIPGPDGNLQSGRRLVNWVWYRNYEPNSPELADVLTDSSGHLHSTTLPVGGMQEQMWSAQKTDARQTLPPQFAELINKTEQPFVQAVMDVISPENLFEDDQVLLVGDALAGFRPHTAASTSQAARSAMLLAMWIKDGVNVGRDEYRSACLDFAREVQRHGVMLGERSQFGRHPLASKR